MDMYDHLNSIKKMVDDVYNEKNKKEKEYNDLLLEYNCITETQNKLTELNFKMKRELEVLHRENERLKENEKEMLNVSSIITTANENTKLKEQIRSLENTIKSLRESNNQHTNDNQDTSDYQEDNLMMIKYKGNTYVIDNANDVYEYVNDTKGKQIGKRKLNKKTNKYKIILD